MALHLHPDLCFDCSLRHYHKVLCSHNGSCLLSYFEKYLTADRKSALYLLLCIMPDNESSPQTFSHHTTAEGISGHGTNNKTPLKARASSTATHGLKHPNRRPRCVQLSEEMECRIVQMDTHVFMNEIVAGTDPTYEDLAKFQEFDEGQLNLSNEYEMYPHIVSDYIFERIYSYSSTVV